MKEHILAILDSQPNSLSAEWIRSHLDYSESRWCLIWPFARNQGGYANLGRDGLIVSRLMCEWRNGPAPDNKPDAAHECGKGRDGCVNPCHMAWKSHSENVADMYRHGRATRFTLTPEQVDEIRSLEGRMRICDIAEKFGVTGSAVHQIFKGKTWKQPHPSMRFFAKEELERIRSTPAPRGSYAVETLAKEFNVSTTVIYKIRRGETHKSFDLATDNPKESQG